MTHQTPRTVPDRRRVVPGCEKTDTGPTLRGSLVRPAPAVWLTGRAEQTDQALHRTAGPSRAEQHGGIRVTLLARFLGPKPLGEVVEVVHEIGETMTTIFDLQRTQPNTMARVPSAVVATCLICVARWLNAHKVDAKTAMTAIDGVSDVVEGAISAEAGELLLFVLTRQGLWALASNDDAEMSAFLARFDAEKAPTLGLNPALLDRAAHDIIASGGRADAKGPFH